MTTDNSHRDAIDDDLDDDWVDPVQRRDETLPEQRYLDRELSWLSFNRRVLELAEDPTVPMLERINFLAIFANNLDEFFMVRVAGLKRRIETGIAVPTNTGRLPVDVLNSIHDAAQQLQVRHATLARDVILPALRESNIEIVTMATLSKNDRAQTDELFFSTIFPVLTPLAVDPAHPFPYISGLSLNLAVRVRNPKSGDQNFARVKVPSILPRFVELRDNGNGQLRFIPLEDLIAHHLGALFPGMEILDHHDFRVTRNEDLELDEEESENLM